MDIHNEDDMLSKPHDTEAERRGWSLYVKGEYEQAESNFRQALEEDANAVDALYGLALVNKGRKNEAEARRLFQKVIDVVESGETKASRDRAAMLRHLSESHLEHLDQGTWQAPAA